MKTKRLFLLAIPFALTLALGDGADTTEACAIAPMQGHTVAIADDIAIVVWDEATKTEHFIRRANFTSKSKSADFGFLVPTPTKPILSEVKNVAFETLAEMTAPEIETRSAPPPGCGCAGSALNKSVAVGAVDQIRVLEETTVAGYDAAVLEAENANALGDWLRERNYPFSDELKEWVKPYIAQKFKITAFKISRKKETENNGVTEIGSTAVKMTFAAEKPFYPYREPTAAGDPPSNRLLRLFVLADKKMEGVVGEGGTKWSRASTVWSKSLTETQRLDLAAKLNLAPPKTWHLTEIEDRTNPRPANDLFFAPAEDAGDVVRQKVIRFTSNKPLPGLMTAAIALTMIGLIVIRKR